MMHLTAIFMQTDKWASSSWQNVIVQRWLEAMQEALKNVAMHAAAMKPKTLSYKDFDISYVEEETQGAYHQDRKKRMKSAKDSETSFEYSKIYLYGSTYS